MRRWFLIALFLALPAIWTLLPAQEPVRARPEPRTVFVLRHAEKDPQGDGRDPRLAEKGQARARSLARLLEHARPEHLFASEYQRTQLTLQPLADKLGRKLEALPAKATAELAQRLRALPAGSVSVVAGHSNTVPGLIQALGGRVERLQQGQLGEDEFDRLFVLTLPPPGLEDALGVGVVELAYGD